MSKAGSFGGSEPRVRPRGKRAFGDAKSDDYPEELLERGARLVFESRRPIAHVGRDLGMAPETLRKYVRRVEADEGRRKDVLSSQEREEIKALRKEVAQLRRANEIWGPPACFSPASSTDTV